VPPTSFFSLVSPRSTLMGTAPMLCRPFSCSYPEVALMGRIGPFPLGKFCSLTPLFPSDYCRSTPLSRGRFRAPGASLFPYQLTPPTRLLKSPFSMRTGDSCGWAWSSSPARSPGGFPSPKIFSNVAICPPWKSPLVHNGDVLFQKLNGSSPLPVHMFLCISRFSFRIPSVL